MPVVGSPISACVSDGSVYSQEVDDENEKPTWTWPAGLPGASEGDKNPVGEGEKTENGGDGLVGGGGTWNFGKL